MNQLKLKKNESCGTNFVPQCTSFIFCYKCDYKKIFNFINFIKVKVHLATYMSCYNPTIKDIMASFVALKTVSFFCA